MAYKINTLNNADIRVIINNKNTAMTLHKNAEILDHPDGSVTTEKIADGAITSDKLSAVASVDTVGGIKLHSGVSGGKKVNRSGLIVDESTGVTYVATQANGGISRNDAGALHIVAATDAEVEAGTDTYKPITPATLKKFRESLSAEIDELNNRFEYSTTPQRIGTWKGEKYDSNVYRTAIDRKLTEAEIASSVAILTKSDIGIKITDEMMILNYGLWAIESVYTSTTQVELDQPYYSYDLDAFVFSGAEDFEKYGLDRLYGFIEFETHEGNIVTT